jgi:glycosyltransferase involved in cell wall biosynthesis
MRICIVSHKFVPNDGQGRVNLELAKYLISRGHKLTIIATQVDAILSSSSSVLVHWVEIPFWAKTALLSNCVFSVKAKHILNKFAKNFDIVHLNGAITNYPADVNSSHFVHSSWIKSPFNTIKVTGGLYSLYQWVYTALNSIWETQAYQSSKMNIAVSDFVKDSLIKDCEVEEKKVTVIWNGVDTQQFRPLETGEINILKQEIGIKNENLLVLFAGAIKNNRKNLDLVLEALVTLPDNVYLAVAGDIEGSPYPAIVEKLNLASKVYFLGHRTDISELLRCADIFTFPSHYDPCPLVILEALASGIPVITTPSVGNSVLIQSEVNGFVLKSSHDTSGMIAILDKLVCNPNLIGPIRQAARNTAEQYTWTKTAAEYEAVYEKLI